MKHILALLWIGIMTLGLVEPARAMTISAGNGTKAQYGDLENDGGTCAATATINSFQYLKTRYGDGAANLVPGAGTDLKDARNKLDAGWDFNGMHRDGIHGCPAKGVLQAWWEAKAQWTVDFGTDIKLDGMTVSPGEPDPNTWKFGKNLKKGAPTCQFLFKELQDGEDVELAFDNAAGAGHVDHAITLTKLSFDDANGNGMCDPGEGGRTMTYLDPNAPGSFIKDIPLTDSALNGGSLGFHWDNGSNPAADVSIYLAFSESVDEPGTIVLVAFGAFLLVGWTRGYWRFNRMSS